MTQTERFATVEYTLVEDGPRRIDRFPARKDGDYSKELPEGARIVQVWGGYYGKDHHTRSPDDE